LGQNFRSSESNGRPKAAPLCSRRRSRVVPVSAQPHVAASLCAHGMQAGRPHLGSPSLDILLREGGPQKTSEYLADVLVCRTDSLFAVSPAAFGHFPHVIFHHLMYGLYVKDAQSNMSTASFHGGRGRSGLDLTHFLLKCGQKAGCGPRTLDQWMSFDVQRLILGMRIALRVGSRALLRS